MLYQQYNLNHISDYLQFYFLFFVDLSVKLFMNDLIFIRVKLLSGYKYNYKELKHFFPPKLI